MSKSCFKSSNNASENKRNKFLTFAAASTPNPSFSAPDDTLFVSTRSEVPEFHSVTPRHAETVEVDAWLYDEVAERLFNVIGDSSFFNGSVSVECDEFDAVLTISAIIYRSATQHCDGSSFSEISDIVPIWWEFATFAECGQVLNDFSFATFKRLFLNGR